MKVYNTLNNKKEEFKSIQPNKVNMYVCGITPYNHCHIGHARCYVSFDVIRRFLKYKGYEVNFLQNFTDIDDKIINSANKGKIDSKKYAEKYIKSYFEDMEKLNVIPANKYFKVTENISSIIKVIKQLIEKEIAYELEGEVFFEVSKFSEYGKLSNRILDEQISGSRIQTDKKKRSPLDFTLWKPAKKNEPFWNSPWSKGRPGWHIECSAMNLDYFNDTLDIHGGGQDLIFPHHENEIAQSECVSGKKFVNYWLHNGFVTINKEKMSKSLDNFFLIKDVLKKFSPEVLRYFLISAHYRTPLDFSDEHLESSKSAYEKLKNFLFELNNIELKNTENIIEKKYENIINQFSEKFDEAMEDDFNTCEAIGQIHSFIHNILKEIKVNSLSEISKNQILKIFNFKIDILGLKIKIKQIQNNKVDELIKILIETRNLSRKSKNFDISDFIRNELKKIKIELRDSKEKTVYVIK